MSVHEKENGGGGTRGVITMDAQSLCVADKEIRILFDTIKGKSDKRDLIKSSAPESVIAKSRE